MSEVPPARRSLHLFRDGFDARQVRPQPLLWGSAGIRLPAPLPLSYRPMGGQLHARVPPFGAEFKHFLSMLMRLTPSICQRFAPTGHSPDALISPDRY